VKGHKLNRDQHVEEKPMEEMIELSVVLPRNFKILVPQQLFSEFEHLVRAENLNEIVTEALSEELKKIRFRIAWDLASTRIR
jgi:hypothetical protein